MATVRKEVVTRASAEAIWDAIADVGALHTRLVPGFVVDTRLEPGARVVTFADGSTVREPIVTLDAPARRLVWTVEGGRTRHFNGAVQVFDTGSMRQVVWTADLLPDEAAPAIEAAMEVGRQAMQRTLDALVGG